jgi:glucose/arabinose dehydrogenase
MKNKKALPILALSTLLAAPATALAQGSDDIASTPLVADTLADGLTHPWGLDFLPDGSAIVTERGGAMRLVAADGTLSDPIEGVPEVRAQGQGGLLDVAAAPDFAETGTIFFTFSEPGDGGAGTAVGRATLVTDEGAPRLEAVETIFTMNAKTDAGQHFGSRIAFHEDGTLFFTIGDRGDGPRSQDPQDHAGSVLRINQDGSVPDDNPGAAGGEWLPEIWSIGHRNPQGMVWDPVTQAIWVNEHGPRGGDELNRPEIGLNYGWPDVSQGVNYDGSPVGEGLREAEGIEQPVYFWDPSPALSGFDVYQGEMFPELEGAFLIGALAHEALIVLPRDETGAISGDEARFFEGELGRIRDVTVAPDGSIWLLTDESAGEIIRVSRGD